MLNNVHVVTVQRGTGLIVSSQMMTQAIANAYVTALSDSPHKEEYFVQVKGPSQKNYDDAVMILSDGRR